MSSYETIAWGAFLRRIAGLRAAGALDVFDSVRFAGMRGALPFSTTKRTGPPSVSSHASLFLFRLADAADVRIDEGVVDLPVARPGRRGDADLRIRREQR